LEREREEKEGAVEDVVTWGSGRIVGG